MRPNLSAVVTLSSYGVTLENKTIHTPLPSIQSWSDLNSATTLQGGDWGGKVLFSL